MIGGAFVAVLVFEVALKVVEVSPLWRVLPLVEPILGEPDARLGYAFTPDAEGVWIEENRARIRINALGLRDSEREVEKKPGTFRVGLVGDSMVEALQVDQSQTFSAVAERNLKSSGINAEVINLAMAGMGPLRQLVRMEVSGYPLNLDLAVFVLNVNDFLNSDMTDDSAFTAYRRGADGSLARSERFLDRRSVRLRDTPFGRAFVWAYQNSAVFRLLYQRLRRPWRSVLNLPAPPPARVAQANICANAGLDAQFDLWMRQQPASAWQITAHFLDDAQRSLAGAGVPAVVMIRALWLPPLSCTEAKEKRSATLAAIQASLRAHGFASVDINTEVDHAIGSPDGGSDAHSVLHGFGVRRGRGHLNLLGHQTYARILEAVVTARIPVGTMSRD
jgi:hypothetical protein